MFELPFQKWDGGHERGCFLVLLLLLLLLIIIIIIKFSQMMLYNCSCYRRVFCFNKSSEQSSFSFRFALSQSRETSTLSCPSSHLRDVLIDPLDQFCKFDSK